MWSKDQLYIELGLKSYLSTIIACSVYFDNRILMLGSESFFLLSLDQIWKFLLKLNDDILQWFFKFS